MKFSIILVLGLGILVSGAFATNMEAEFIPEASGVCKVGDSLIIAGDEEPKSLWMIQDSTQKLEKIAVKGAAWDDMEDLAAVDANRFFAMTSHSRTKKGKRKPEREQLLLVSKNNKKLEALQSWSLRDQILKTLDKNLGNELDMQTVEAASPDEGGLNVEGLAYSGGQLYLGLRAPLTANGEAIVLVIKNAAELFNGEAPVFGGVLRLTLGDKGIRGLVAKPDGLFVLSGSTNDTAETFGLNQFHFAGMSVSKYPVSDFDKLIRPEGIALEADGSLIVVQDFEAVQTQEIIIRLGL